MQALHYVIRLATYGCQEHREWNINVTSKLFEVQPIIKRSFTPMERRRDDVVLCRARIGHAYFTNGYLLRGELRPMCCNTRLTVRHVLLSCAKYAHIRRKYFAFNSLFELFRQYSSHCKTCPSQLCEICAHQKEVFCI